MKKYSMYMHVAYIIDVHQTSTPPSGIKVFYSSCKGSRNSSVWCKTIIPIEE